MKAGIKTVSGFFIGTMLFGAAIFGISYAGWEMYNFFAPKYASTQSLVFHHSPEYVHGKIQELQELESRYDVATPTQKTALRSVIIDEFSQYNGRLTPQLQQFYHKIQAEQGE